MSLPVVLPWADVQSRLQIIFPEGTPKRLDCTREIAAKTVFVMLYVGAVADRDVWIRPDQVTRMTDDQAAATSDDDRLGWIKVSLSKSKAPIPGRWYAVNTRESIRDDTLRNGLIENGAVVTRPDLPVTSSAGRYALESGFASLFDPELDEAAFKAAAEAWAEGHLNAGVRMRIAVMRGGAAKSAEKIKVEFPSGESRLMSPGPSSYLSKTVIETFAAKFLKTPAVIFLSESGNKVVARDDELARKIGLTIRAEKNLPDIILADLAPAKPLLVFVEVVATDGPVTEARKKALQAIAEDAGFSPDQLAYVTAYLDRSGAPFKKTINELAWGSYAWFAAEPDGLVELTVGRLGLL